MTVLNALLNPQSSIREPTASEYECHVLVAASHCNLPSVVKDMAKTVFPRLKGAPKSSILGSAVCLAAENGYTQVLEVIFDSMEYIKSDLASEAPHRTSPRLSSQKKHLEQLKAPVSSVITIAALIGNAKLAQQLLTERWDVIVPDPKESVEDTMDMLIGFATPNVELHRWIEDFRKLVSYPARKLGKLDRQKVVNMYQRDALERNWVAMARYLFENDPASASPDYGIAQIWLNACRAGHKDMVKLITQYCPVSGRTRLAKDRTMQGIERAAAGGHLDIVQMLVENTKDLDLNEGDIPPLHRAFELEHVRMIRYLLDHGANFEDPVKTIQLVSRLKSQGLTSMLDLLAEEGVDMVNVSGSSANCLAV
ncbi:hypothetical protein BT63DRAFT_332965 [Microthyrium microscopicum]|uniref:Uncharacterized protein n=1 Tax=Microthyrium microscopicum TaxID=703497 RepID=A0A6A6U7Z9_9PEZI|nr:hypothetical protein BT63DRAFT_332965 [Microthyrium microscopicum]